MTGIELTHIQYPGNAAAYSDLLAGRVQLIFADLASALQYVKSGGLRGLAVTSLTRSAELPDLPAAGFGRHECTEFGGRESHRFRAEGRKTRFDGRIG
jgi:ABC-type amino acid transport substrate-binding protein